MSTHPTQPHFNFLEPPLLPHSASTSRSASPASRYEGVVVFAYGSNLWTQQVFHRCPSAKLLGVGRLRHWSWQINEVGYANIVDSPATPYDAATLAWLGPLGAGRKESKDRVYGLVYLMSEEDELKLDGYQDVGDSYEKQWQWIELWAHQDPQNHLAGKLDISKKAKRIKATFYADKTHVVKGVKKCIPELAYKIRQGIVDAVKQGVPEKYVADCIRPFLPEMDDTEEQVKDAIRLAISKGIDVRDLLKQVEDELSETGAKKYSEQKLNGSMILNDLALGLSRPSKVEQKATEAATQEGARGRGITST